MSLKVVREVVVLLDRSASMGYGDHWARAQEAARKAVSSLTGGDVATLVLFDQGPEEVVRGSSNAGQIDLAIRQAKVSSGSTRYAPALRLAQSLVSRSALPRKEIILISDFQKSGWERQEEIRLPEGATITPVSVAELETADLSVSSVAIQRATFSGQERVTITAGLTNRGGTPITKLPVQLEIDGRVIHAKEISIGPNAAGSVAFDPVTVTESNVQGAIRAGSDALPKDNAFYFVLSPSRPVSVLVIHADGANRNASLYLTTVLALGKAPPFKTDVLPASRVTAASFEGRSVVILDDASALSTATADLLNRFVQQGGGLFIALGERTPVSGDWPLFPGKPGSMVDRTSTRGGTLGTIDYGHQIFDDFKDPRNGLAGIRFWRYRSATLGPDDKVLAHFDDGATAMAERRVGNGRVVAFMSTVDGSWNEAPKHSMFLPLIHEVVTYVAQYEQSAPWQTVGRMLDIGGAVGSLVRSGAVGSTRGSAEGASGVVVSPSGEQVRLGQGGVPSVELAEQGFYSVRLSGTGERRPYAVAANLDPVESDLSALQPAEFLAGVTGTGVTQAVGESLDRPTLTPADMEKKQSIWWFLLVAGLTALLAEAVVSNRIPVRSGAAPQPAAGS